MLLGLASVARADYEQAGVVDADHSEIAVISTDAGFSAGTIDKALKDVGAPADMWSGIRAACFAKVELSGSQQFPGPATVSVRRTWTKRWNWVPLNGDMFQDPPQIREVRIVYSQSGEAKASAGNYSGVHRVDSSLSSSFNGGITESAEAYANTNETKPMSHGGTAIDMENGAPKYHTGMAISVEVMVAASTTIGSCSANLPFPGATGSSALAQAGSATAPNTSEITSVDLRAPDPVFP